MGFLRVAGWPTALLVLLGGTLAIGLPVGGYYAYRAYDFVEHDNEFCMSCHLMSGPFEAFARSEHRGLGCKACHQPTLMGRSQMALTQVLEQPRELESHAVVPDELCTGCHVDGDPDQWLLISRSAGHRVHLESTDPSLDNVGCVECHSNSIHQFSATDDTCGQSDCHTDTEIHLGRMGDFTIHCVACHAFRAPLSEQATSDEIVAALRPEAAECLSCHVMRALVDSPPDEAHRGVCSACHNPHIQETAAEAARTCVNVGCHEQVEEESDAHLGLPATGLTDCTACHTAHDFAVDGGDCASCHTVVSDPPHNDHATVACLSCHAEDVSHGRVAVVTADQCQSCHHDAAPPESCGNCHGGGLGVPVTPSTVTRSVRSVGNEGRSRSLPFDHEVHAGETCATCHTGASPALDARSVECTQCHADHHRPDSPCMTCHVQAPVADHPIERVHVGCGGAGCHIDAPFLTAQNPSVPRTRAVCLSCHQELEDHRPEGNCVDCHTLPGGGG